MLFTLFRNNLEIFTSEFFIILTSLILLLFCVLTTKKNKNILIISFLNHINLYILILCLIFIINTPHLIFITDIFIFDSFAKFIKLILIISSIFFFFLQYNFIKNKKLIKFENNILILLSITGLLLLISSNNLIILYLAIELQSLCFYILACSNEKSPFSVEAALKYFILGSIASGFILYGSSLIYGVTGSLIFSNISCILLNINNIMNFQFIICILYSITFIIIGLLFKIGAAPFHNWLPDVYEGSPSNITAFFSIVPKIALLGLLCRLLFDVFFDIIEFLKIIFFISSFLSIIIGSLITLQQNKIKRLIAYSSISHVGFILMGFISNSLQSLQNIFIYSIIYIIMSINIWSILISVKLNKKYIKYLSNFINLSKLNPILAYIILLNFFSMAGIPPLAGFFSKMFIFSSVIKEGFFSLAFIGIIASIINTFYYIRIVKIMFFDNSLNFNFLEIIPKNICLILFINIQLVVFFCLYSDFFLIFIKKIILLFIL